MNLIPCTRNCAWWIVLDTIEFSIRTIIDDVHAVPFFKLFLTVKEVRAWIKENTYAESNQSMLASSLSLTDDIVTSDIIVFFYYTILYTKLTKEISMCFWFPWHVFILICVNNVFSHRYCRSKPRYLYILCTIYRRRVGFRRNTCFKIKSSHIWVLKCSNQILVFQILCYRYILRLLCYNLTWSHMILTANCGRVMLLLMLFRQRLFCFTQWEADYTM